MVQTNDQGQCGEFSGLDNLIIIKSAGEIPQLFLRGRIMQVSQPRTGLSMLNGPRLFYFFFKLLSVFRYSLGEMSVFVKELLKIA